MLFDGVEIKKLETMDDERGFFREIIRKTDSFFQNIEFAQWSHSFMYEGVIKAWHHHKKQTDYWYVVSGTLKVGLYDLRENSPTKLQTREILMGDGHDAICIKIPPGIAHGCKVIKGPCNLLYMMDKTYDPEDEYRIPHDDPEIGFEWS